MQKLQSSQSACYHFSSDQLYNSKARVFPYCEFRPLGLFLIRIECRRKPRHKSQRWRACLSQHKQKMPCTCLQHITASLALTKPFCHLPEHTTGTCSIMLCKHFSRGLKFSLWLFKEQNIVKQQQQMSLNWRFSKTIKKVIMPQRCYMGAEETHINCYAKSMWSSRSGQHIQGSDPYSSSLGARVCSLLQSTKTA